MRSHVSKSTTYLIILGVSLVVAIISIVTTNTKLQVNAFIPFNSQPLFVSEPVEDNPAAAIFDLNNRQQKTS